MRPTRTPSLRKRISARVRLLRKMYLDRRRHRGARDYAFRWHRSEGPLHVISVRHRSNGFRADLHLRRDTTDLATFEQVFCNHDYNLRRLARWTDIVATYERLSREGSPLILDLGANVGLATVQFRSQWPKSFVVSVEPDDANFAILRRNVEPLGNTLPVHAAVAATDGFARIVDPAAAAWAKQTELTAESTGTRAVSVATLLEEARKRQPDCQPFLCKVDIEGFEANLFSANTEWVAQFPLIVIELHDWMLPGQGKARTFLRAVAEHDRDFVHLGENVFSIRNDRRLAP